MTDKEKLDKLVAEIERLIGDYNIKTEKCRGINEQAHQYYGGKRDALSEILKSIGTMQKEPKECMYSNNNYTDEDRKVLCGGCEEECKFNKKEEPVSEDLEAAIDNYLATYWGGEKEKQDWPFLKKMAIHFANWQKKKNDYAIGIAHMAGEEEGKNIMKQQMMAKAIDGVVHRFDGCGVASVHYNDPNGIPMAYFIPSEGLSAGDKVKIITIKKG